jgi:hypothetical protein
MNPTFAPGGPRSRVWPDLDRKKGDLFATKFRASAFFRQVRSGRIATALGIDTLLIAGAVRRCTSRQRGDPTPLGLSAVES